MAPGDHATIMGSVLERGYSDDELAPQPMDIDLPRDPFPVAVHRKQSKVIKPRARPDGPYGLSYRSSFGPVSCGLSKTVFVAFLSC
jgi:hypothetical protein